VGNGIFAVAPGVAVRAFAPRGVNC